LDSWCFQTVGHHGIEAIAQAWELPLVRQETSGKSERQTLDYEKTEQDEVEDLYLLLQKVKVRSPLSFLG
jgi:diphthine-ammonia ligase